MISRFIAFCLQQRLLIISTSIVLAAIGILSFERLPIQAFPDVQNVFVQVVTQYPGQAPGRGGKTHQPAHQKRK